MSASSRFAVGLPRPRRRVAGLLVSLVLHLAVVLLLVYHPGAPWDPTRAPGPTWLTPGGGGGGGGGGPEVAYISLPPAPPAPAAAAAETPVETPPEIQPPEPEPTPAVVPPLDSMPHPRVDTTALAVRPATGAGPGVGPGSGGGQGGGSGGGIGTGTGSGTGPGSGPGSGGGQGGTIRPPQWIHGSMPFDRPPKELRGKTIHVTVWVRTNGEVARIAVDPPITDREYAEKFEAVMETFRFRPARAPDGTAVPGTMEMDWTLPTN